MMQTQRLTSKSKAVGACLEITFRSRIDYRDRQYIEPLFRCVGCLSEGDFVTSKPSEFEKHFEEHIVRMDFRFEDEPTKVKELREQIGKHLATPLYYPQK